MDLDSWRKSGDERRGRMSFFSQGPFTKQTDSQKYKASWMLKREREREKKKKPLKSANLMMLLAK